MVVFVRTCGMSTCVSQLYITYCVCVCLLCEVSVTLFPLHQFSRNHERLSHYSLPS